MNGEATAGLASPRSFDYLRLRVCERLGLCPREWFGLRYEEQVELLAYEMLREQEEACVMPG